MSDLVNEIYENDIRYIHSCRFIDFDELCNKTVLITGSTGLIGFSLTTALLEYNIRHSGNISIIAVVRDLQKAKKMYCDYPDGAITFIVSDINDVFSVEGEIDYIIHGASQTSSKAFVSEPVETIRTAVQGTLNMLELAREKQVKSFVYLSSMEVYGAPENDEKITEKSPAYLDTMSVRTSYPESKRLCESLCSAYYSEYGISTKVIRLTQTFGLGVLYNDARVFADFARCVIESRDIVLHTKGETRRNYLYTADAVTAILAVLLSGQGGEAYNAANEDTYCSIYEMAELVAGLSEDGITTVKIEIEDETVFGYAPTLIMNLDTSKLQKLGWGAKTDLKEMFSRLILCMKAEKVRGDNINEYYSSNINRGH